MKKRIINAVYDDDLINLLKKIKYYDTIIKSEIHCQYCKIIITLNNIHSLLPENNIMKFTCDDAICISKLIKSLDKDSYNAKLK